MKRPPVFLNMLQIRFPLTAIASILHRLSGLALFFLIPGLLWVFKRTLDSEQSFLRMQEWFSYGCIKVVVWLFLVGLLYHLLAGIRHLYMDMGWFESRKAGTFTASTVIILALVGAIGFGLTLWGVSL